MTMVHHQLGTWVLEPHGNLAHVGINRVNGPLTPWHPGSGDINPEYAPTWSMNMDGKLEDEPRLLVPR
jgi:hypothetical protein